MILCFYRNLRKMNSHSADIARAMLSRYEGDLDGHDIDDSNHE